MLSWLFGKNYESRLLMMSGEFERVSLNFRSIRSITPNTDVKSPLKDFHGSCFLKVDPHIAKRLEKKGVQFINGFVLADHSKRSIEARMG